MRTVAREVARGLAFIAIGVVVALAVVLVQGVEASPDEPRISWVYRGVSPFYGWQCYPWNQFAGWHECWHDNEGGYTAIDYNRGEQTAGSGIWLDYDGDFELFKMTAHTGLCKGVHIELYWESYDPANYRGDMHYLHIDPNPLWLNEELPYQVIYIGDVAEEENPACTGPQYWTGPHLHQSARVTSETPFCTNKFEDPSEGDNWQHKVHWLPDYTNDTDCDRWTDDDEDYIGTDPLDDCADDPSDDAWPPDFDNDQDCDIVDVLKFKPHIMCQIGQACYDARFDLDADGDVDIVDIVVRLKPVILMSCAP